MAYVGGQSMGNTSLAIFQAYEALHDKALRRFNKLSDLPSAGNFSSWRRPYERAFTVFFALWRYQQLNRPALVEHGLKRSDIGEIASKIGQLYYNFYLRTSDTQQLCEAYVFYQAIQTRQYFMDSAPSAIGDQRSSGGRSLLAARELRFYARFIVLCLLLNKKEEAWGLLQEFQAHISAHLMQRGARPTGSSDGLDWHAVIAELTAFMNADVGLPVPRSPGSRVEFKPTLRCRVPATGGPAAGGTPYHHVPRVKGAVFISFYPHQVKIAELPLDVFRMMQTLEWQDAHLSAQQQEGQEGQQQQQPAISASGSVGGQPSAVTSAALPSHQAKICTVEALHPALEPSDGRLDQLREAFTKRGVGASFTVRPAAGEMASVPPPPPPTNVSSSTAVSTAAVPSSNVTPASTAPTVSGIVAPTAHYGSVFALPAAIKDVVLDGRDGRDAPAPSGVSPPSERPSAPIWSLNSEKAEPARQQQPTTVVATACAPRGGDHSSRSGEHMRILSSDDQAAVALAELSVILPPQVLEHGMSPNPSISPQAAASSSGPAVPAVQAAAASVSSSVVEPCSVQRLECPPKHVAYRMPAAALLALLTATAECCKRDDILFVYISASGSPTPASDSSGVAAGGVSSSTGGGTGAGPASSPAPAAAMGPIAAAVASARAAIAAGAAGLSQAGSSIAAGLDARPDSRSEAVAGQQHLEGVMLSPPPPSTSLEGRLDAADSLLYPEDLLPLTRRTLFLVVDSDASHVFKRLQGREVSRPVLCLLSPSWRGGEVHDPLRSGALFSLFLSCPVMAFCVLCGVRDPSADQLQSMQSTLDDVIAHVERSAAAAFGALSTGSSRGATRSASAAAAAGGAAAWAAAMDDGLLRQHILRFALCRAALTMRLAVASSSDGVSSQGGGGAGGGFPPAEKALPTCFPDLPRELSAEAAELRQAVLRVVGTVRKEALFVVPS